MWNLCRIGLLFIISLGWLVPLPAAAQDDPHPLSWDDMPVLPRHRSEADWLVDVGWKTFGEVYGPFLTHLYEVGEEEQFIPLGSFSTVTASFALRYRSEHAYFWFERGARVNEKALEAAADYFEQHIWPMNNSIFGDEWNPGIDGDSHLHIVNQSSIDPTIMGAFSPTDQCPQFLCPDSNQREIIYINLDLAPLDTEEYLTTLAHEHQHLILHNMDGNETRWLNEGLSQLAEHFNGFDPDHIGGDNMRDFLANPDHQLNYWIFDGWEMASNYGSAYLFLVYLYERFGLDFIRTLTHVDYEGMAAIQHALRDSGQPVTVDQVFADWILANYLDDPAVGDGRYYYQTLDLPEQIEPQRLIASQPYLDSVHQYAADYLLIREPGTYRLSFDGDDRVPVMGADPYSGDWMWWSMNYSDSATRLTGAFDLSGLTAATLVYQSWWNIEDDYDWFHVLVSPDMGATWEIVRGDLAAVRGTDAPGAYYSGQSSGWMEERIDLSRYAGKPILIRFEYLTDTTATGPGIVLDDIRIPELNYVDDTESASTVWNPEGFLRIPAVTAQHWTVSLVSVPSDGSAPTVTPLALDASNVGGTTCTVPADSMLTIVIGAMAPFTVDEVNYKLSVQRE